MSARNEGSARLPWTWALSRSTPTDRLGPQATPPLSDIHRDADAACSVVERSSRLRVRDRRRVVLGLGGGRVPVLETIEARAALPGRVRPHPLGGAVGPSAPRSSRGSVPVTNAYTYSSFEKIRVRALQKSVEREHELPLASMTPGCAGPRRLAGDLVN